MATTSGKLRNVLSPIVIFVYKRPTHTLRLLKSLLECDEFSTSKIFIFSDGPKREIDKREVDNVRKIVHTVTSGLNCHVIYRHSNLGLANSVISGVTEVLKDHSSVIVLEDDLTVGKDFLKYMNWGLQVFQDNPQIFSLTGYSFPENYFSVPANYSNNVFLSPRCGSWSWATWRDRWASVDWGLSDFQEFCEDKNRQTMFDRIGWDLSRMLKFQAAGAIDSWAIRFCYAHFKAKAHCVHPRSTLVHNLGLDRSGRHSKPDRRFSHHGGFSPWQEREGDRFVVPSREVNRAVFRIYAGQSGPFLSRLRRSLYRSVIGGWVQRLSLRRSSRLNT